MFISWVCICKYVYIYHHYWLTKLRVGSIPYRLWSQIPGFPSQVFHSLALWPSASHLTSLRQLLSIVKGDNNRIYIAEWLSASMCKAQCNKCALHRQNKYLWRSLWSQVPIVTEKDVSENSFTEFQGDICRHCSQQHRGFGRWGVRSGGPN